MDDLLDPQVTNNNDNNGFVNQAQIPNAGGILALGIISIATCWLYAIPGIVCGIIAIAMFGKAKQIYESNPDKYRTSFGNAKAGYICGIIGLSLSALYIIFIILAIIGAVNGSRF